MVFTSGIVDEGPPVGRDRLSTAQLAGVCRWGWVWNLVVAGWWVGLAHCWVLKDQAPPGSVRVSEILLGLLGGRPACAVVVLLGGFVV